MGTVGGRKGRKERRGKWAAFVERTGSMGMVRAFSFGGFEREY